MVHSGGRASKTASSGTARRATSRSIRRSGRWATGATIRCPRSTRSSTARSHTARAASAGTSRRVRRRGARGPDATSAPLRGRLVPDGGGTEPLTPGFQTRLLLLARKDDLVASVVIEFRQETGQHRNLLADLSDPLFKRSEQLRARHSLEGGQTVGSDRAQPIGIYNPIRPLL